MAGKNGYSTIPAGVVTRPTDNDKMVKLRATVEYGMATSVKDFTLTVKKAAKELRDDDFTAYFLTHFIGTEKRRPTSKHILLSVRMRITGRIYMWEALRI